MTTHEPDPRRRIPLPGTSNLRDVGGYPTGGGGTIAHGRLLRGEVLTRRGDETSIHGTWDPTQGSGFRDLGLRLVVDLRSDQEVERTASAWAEATGATTVRVPMAQGGEGADTDFVRQLLSGERARFTEDDLTSFYVETFLTRAPVFAEIVELVSRADSLPVLLHCTAGKDRTGLAIALVMELLGCPREAVVVEYALTGVLRPNRVAAYAPMFLDAGVDPEIARPLFETPAASMHDALARLDDTYGDVASYLRHAGAMSARTHQRLVDALVEPPHSRTGHLCSKGNDPEGGGG